MRDGAWVAEAADLVNLSWWPARPGGFCTRNSPGRAIAVTGADGTRGTASSPTPGPVSYPGRSPIWSNGTVSTPASRTADRPAAPEDYCWGPFQGSGTAVDFVDVMATICGNGSPNTQPGVAFHVYSATTSMKGRVFGNADGEMLIVPQVGGLNVVTEYGILELRFGEIAVIPKGVRFRFELLDGYAGGFVCENFGLPLRLPELGLIGSNGLANTNDFQVPVAAYEDYDGPVQWISWPDAKCPACTSVNSVNGDDNGASPLVAA